VQISSVKYTSYSLLFSKKCTAACIVGAAADVLYILFLLGTLAIKNTDLFDEYHASRNVCS